MATEPTDGRADDNACRESVIHPENSRRGEVTPPHLWLDSLAHRSNGQKIMEKSYTDDSMTII
jgi:hypothetical protein